MQHQRGHGHSFAKDYAKCIGHVITGCNRRTMLMLVMIIMAIVWSLPAFAAVQSIRKIDVTNQASVVQIVVDCSRPISLHKEKIGDKFLAFDVYGNMNSTQCKTVSIKSGGVDYVKCSFFKSNPAVARIAVCAPGSRIHDIAYDNGNRRAVIRVWKKDAQVSKSTKEIPGKTVQQNAGIQIALPKINNTPDALASAPEAEVKPVLVASADPAVIVAAASMQPQTAPRAAAKISLDFVESEIHDVLKALAVQAGENIVASSDVKGKITASLSGVTVDEALKLVTNLSGYRYAQANGSYVVGTTDNLRALDANSGPASERTTEVVAVLYSKPATLTKMLESQFKMVGISNSGESTESKDASKSYSFIALTGPASDVAAAKAFVDKVEQTLVDKAASFMTELYEVKYADINEAASMLSVMCPGLMVGVGPNQGFDLKCPTAMMVGTTSSGSGDSGGGSGGQGSANAKAPSKVLVLHGVKGDVDKAKDFLTKFDVQEPQIIIEAKVVDIANDASKELGIDWSWDSFNVGETDRTAFILDDKGNPQKPQVLPVSFGRFHRTPFELLAKVHALVGSGKGRILANPNVMALDAKPASIFIGDEVKYVVSIDQTPTGINVKTETALVGIQLHTISRVSRDGYITMALHPEVSVITNWRDTPAGLSLPEISRRFVDSTVRIKNGETIVIGGLIKEEELERMSGLPILKDLPFIGGLFKNTIKTKDHSEIMMFITPRIVTSN